MPDILQDFSIAVSPARIFEGVSTPALLDEWWTLRSAGRAVVGTSYELDFGPQYLWRAVVTQSVADRSFEWRMTHADSDWTNTLVGFELEPVGAQTMVRFHHRGWPAANEHFRISSHCWALYLRILRRHLEHGESVPYAQRLSE